jgi:hypothetical protein
MVPAGDQIGIHDLLAASNHSGQNAWWMFLSSNNQSAVFVSDLDRAYRLALQSSNSFHLLYRYTAIRSSLKTTVQCISSHVLAVLVAHGLWDIRQGVAVANQIRSPQNAAEMLTALTELSVGGDLFDQLIRDASARIEKLDGSFEKGQLAARCCRMAAGELRVRLFRIAIDCVLSIHSLYLPRITEIIDMLPLELRSEGIQSILDGIQDPAGGATYFATNLGGTETNDLPSWTAGLQQWCESWFQRNSTAAEPTSLEDSRESRRDASRKLDCIAPGKKWLSSLKRRLTGAGTADEPPHDARLPATGIGPALSHDEATKDNVPGSLLPALIAPDNKSLASPPLI